MMVNGSSRAYCACPHSFAAAICRQIAWFEFLIPGTAILSPSRKSLIDVTVERLVVRINGIACAAHSARTSFAVPTVLSHSVARPGTPAMPKCICPPISASTSDCVPPSVR